MLGAARPNFKIAAKWAYFSPFVSYSQWLTGSENTGCKEIQGEATTVIISKRAHLPKDKLTPWPVRHCLFLLFTGCSPYNGMRCVVFFGSELFTSPSFGLPIQDFSNRALTETINKLQIHSTLLLGINKPFPLGLRRSAGAI